MSDFLTPVESYLDGTVTVHSVTAPFDDHDELYWTVDETAGLKFSDVFPDLKEGLPDNALLMHPTIHHDQGENQRDPVSTENILHLDGSCEPLRLAASLVIAREAEPGVPPTRFVSPTGFLALAKCLGIFEKFDPSDVDTVFGYSAYYSQTQPYWLSLKPGSERLHEVIANDFVRDKVSTREGLVYKLDHDPWRGKRRFPLIAPHSVTGEESIMIDAGVRHIELAAGRGIDNEIDEHDLLEAFINLRLLLAKAELLDDERLTAYVTPQTGLAVAFPKETLHNQEPPETTEAENAKRRMSVLGLVAIAPESRLYQTIPLINA